MRWWLVATRLTRRGKIVVGILIALAVWWAFDATTPDECKVPVEQMSQFCLDVMFP